MNENNDIQLGLDQDAETVAERMPETLTVEDVERVRELLRRFMESQHLSQGKVGKLLGVSNTMIGAFLRGHYKGRVPKLMNKIINLVNSLERKARQTEGKEFVETVVARRIYTLITQTDAFSTDEEGRISAIIGDSGHGKSMCLREYANANLNSIYILLDPAMKTRGMFVEIANRLRTYISGSLSAVTREIIDVLRRRHAILMLDEASWFSVHELDLLRQIIVMAGRCPLILAGNGNLLKTIMQDSTKRGYESLDQFRSRMLQILNLDDASGDRGGGLYSPDEVRKLYQYGGIKLTGDAVDYLQRICRTPGSGRLRTCNLIIGAIHTSGVVQRQGYIDRRAIERAIRQLGLFVEGWLPLVVDREETEQKIAAVG